MNCLLPNRVWFALLAAACLLVPAMSAQVDATQMGSGTVNVLRGWREHEGDDAAWAAADFNDSAWSEVNLDDLGAATRGTRWYRIHVTLADKHPHLHLLVAGGEGTYELYVNGEKQDGPGLLGPFRVKRPTEQVYSLDDAGANDVVLALRTRANSTYTSWHLPLFLTVAVGTPDAIDNERQALESGRLYAALPSIMMNLVLVLAGIAAFALHRSQRQRREYLYLGLYLFLLGLSDLLLGCASAGVIPLGWNNLAADPMIYLFTITQIEFTFSFAAQRVTRIWRVYEALLLAPLACLALVELGLFPSTTYLLIEAVIILPAAVLLPVMLLVWYKRGNREAGWLIVPSLFPAATGALTDIGSVSIYTGWGRADFLSDPIMAGPIPLRLSDLGAILFLLAIGLVMFFRFTRVTLEQARAAAELSAARDIQRRLVPAMLPAVEGYMLEAAYLPAAEVGGDFYQVMETRDGTLVVVGDVSGKGLKAAMTSTLALGALQALANEELGPGALLTRLNRQLARTSEEGFVTCLCVRISPYGEVTMANAGHLQPYRNGREITLQPGLPLGLADEVTYEEREFCLEEGDRLTLLSDGVVEARDARGQLFGFDRTQAISAEPADAIAEAALRYGQADDITVLTLTRVKHKPLAAQAQAAAATVVEG